MRTLTLKNWLEVQKTGRKFYYEIECEKFKVGGASDDDVNIGETVIYKDSCGEWLAVVKNKTIY